MKLVGVNLGAEHFARGLLVFTEQRCASKADKNGVAQPALHPTSQLSLPKPPKIPYFCDQSVKKSFAINACYFFDQYSAIYYIFSLTFTWFYCWIVMDFH